MRPCVVDRARHRTDSCDGKSQLRMPLAEDLRARHESQAMTGRSRFHLTPYSSSYWFTVVVNADDARKSSYLRDGGTYAAVRRTGHR